MVQLAIIFAAAAVFMTVERLRPGRELPNPAGWYARAALLNGIQLAIVVVAGVTWNRWFASLALVGMSKYLPPVAEGLLAWFVGTFVFYWWHRLRHSSDLVWRALHQVHHSPQRIEALTSFYKHPLEIAINSVLASAIVFVLLGGSIEGAAWFNVFAATGEMFYHSNIRTPRWMGWFMQRPEHHSIHHQVGVHDFNFGDITWWDRLFGTFREAPDFSPACGFENDAERKLGSMLLFRINDCPQHLGTGTAAVPPPPETIAREDALPNSGPALRAERRRTMHKQPRRRVERGIGSSSRRITRYATGIG